MPESCWNSIRWGLMVATVRLMCRKQRGFSQGGRLCLGIIRSGQPLLLKTREKKGLMWWEKMATGFVEITMMLVKNMS